MRNSFFSMFLGAMLAPLGTEAHAQDCSTALAFALDVSVSVDDTEYRLQRDGLAIALRASEIVALILAQPAPVFLMAYEWSGVRQQEIIAPWQAINVPEDLALFASRLSGHDREDPLFPTALGPAIGFGLSQLEHHSTCERRVLDVSGDGANNDGFAPAFAYKHIPTLDLTVNGLVVIGAESSIIQYYEEEVLFGNGSFVEIAQGFENYAAAMQRKLLRELTPPQIAMR